MRNSILVRGARENNLKNVFDTIYAEGRRRYVDSLSAYARQFLGQMDKPDVDVIEGLSPAISIDQKTTSRNPRSTVGTVTEIYDYLRLLWARAGTPHCPRCGREIRRQTVDQIVDKVLALPEGTRYLAFSPDVLERIASRYGPVRVGFTGALTEEELARYGRSRAVQGISAGDAHEFLCQLQADEAFSPVRTAAARAAVWDAFLRQDLDLLPATLPDALRASSSALLTDLTALDYDALERTLEFLANNSATVAAQALPGQWNAASGTYTVTDASRAAMQTFFNVSPTEAQASSFSEP